MSSWRSYSIACSLRCNATALSCAWTICPGESESDFPVHADDANRIGGPLLHYLPAVPCPHPVRQVGQHYPKCPCVERAQELAEVL